MKYTYLSLLVGVLLLPVLVQAETVVRTGSSVSVTSDQTIEEDFYAAGEAVTMSGVVRGDMYTAGASVTINGEVLSDLTIFGGAAQVHAPVTDDVRVVGGEVVIAESVGGDVFVMGGLLKVLSTAEITGDVYFFGGDAEINAPVGGSVMGTAERIRVDSSVAGNIDVVAAQQLTLGERANVAGDVSYRSGNELIRAQNAVVVGTVSRNTAPVTSTPVSPQQVVTPLFVILFTTLLLYLFMRPKLETFAAEAVREYGRNGLIGLAVVFGAPLVIVLSLVSVLGILVGVLGILAMIVLYLLTIVLSGVVLGAVAAKLLTKEPAVNLSWVLLGTTVSYALLFVPVAGPVVLVLLAAVTLGTLVSKAYASVR